MEGPDLAQPFGRGQGGHRDPLERTSVFRAETIVMTPKKRCALYTRKSSDEVIYDLKIVHGTYIGTLDL